jgi:hypothetical protein
MASSLTASSSLPGHHTDDPFAAAVLRPVTLGRHPLDETSFAQGDHHSLVGDQVFFTELGNTVVADLRPPGVTVFLLEFGHFGLDQLQDPPRVFQQVFQVADRLEHLGVLIQYLLPFEVGQPA